MTRGPLARISLRLAIKNEQADAPAGRIAWPDVENAARRLARASESDPEASSGSISLSGSDAGARVRVLVERTDAMVNFYIGVESGAFDPDFFMNAGRAPAMIVRVRDLLEQPTPDLSTEPLEF